VGYMGPQVRREKKYRNTRGRRDRLVKKFTTKLSRPKKRGAGEGGMGLCEERGTDER